MEKDEKEAKVKEWPWNAKKHRNVMGSWCTNAFQCDLQQRRKEKDVREEEDNIGIPLFDMLGFLCIPLLGSLLPLLFFLPLLISPLPSISPLSPLLTSPLLYFSFFKEFMVKTTSQWIRLLCFVFQETSLLVLLLSLGGTL
jgi:hypothetical protein